MIMGFLLSPPLQDVAILAGGVLPGLKWSSQHFEGGAQAAFGSVWSGAIVLTRSPGGGRTGSAAAVLGCDCGRYGE